MKWNPKSFGVKLWCWFLFFAAVIFAALWLLQTVFLERFYDGMVIRNVEQVAEEIRKQQNDAHLQDIITDYAARESVLIFLTDWEGMIFYSADEHNSVYDDSQLGKAAHDSEDNPYFHSDTPRSWRIGAFRNLPSGYGEFLRRLSASETGTVGYRTESGDAYVYGTVLSGTEQWFGESAVLYLSTPLGGAGAAAGILRVQLLWVTLASLVLSVFLAYFISRQFARPVSAICRQAKRMASGEFGGEYQKGFCAELDALSDTLLETAASLERLENARRELLANVSHDLRTPLTMIKGYAEMVKEFSWSDDAQREKDLSVIIREADRLTGLVNGILEYTVVQMPDTAAEFRDFDLSAVTESVAEQFAQLFIQKGGELETSVQPGLRVCGDEEQLKRVLYNWIDNACCHSGEKPRVRVSLMESGAFVRAEVRDFGKGISQEELPDLWDRYFTTKQRQRSGSHSGLGLAITKEILQKHSAKFGVESRNGQGCIFWFEMEMQS